MSYDLRIKRTEREWFRYWGNFFGIVSQNWFSFTEHALIAALFLYLYKKTDAVVFFVLYSISIALITSKLTHIANYYHVFVAEEKNPPLWKILVLGLSAVCFYIGIFSFVYYCVGKVAEHYPT